MKAKLLFLLAGLALSGFVMNGCYTQVARPDRDDETTVSNNEEEYTEEETEEAQASEARRDDVRHHTEVYIYGGSWYDPWYSSWYRYPRSRFYFSAGFGYDPWGWCGTTWDWGYDPWCGSGYYGRYWGSYYRGWRPAYYYDPFYRHYPSYVTRDRVVESKKRPMTRRGLKPGSDQSSGTYVSGGGGGSLLRPASRIYTRGTDGTYRRVRKGDAASGRTTIDDQNSAQPVRGSREAVKRGTRDAGDIKRTATTPDKASGGNQGSVRRSRKPSSSSGDSYNKPRSGSSSRGSGGSVSKPSGGSSSGGGSAPKSSGGSSSGGSSSKRPSRN
ncbi:MAG: hypothetical protein ACREOI_23700 [bacterium]